MKPAYSLVEMLMVVSIMSFLLSMNIPRFDELNLKARYLEVLSHANALQAGVEACYLIGGDLNQCFSGKNGIPKMIKNKSGIIESSEVKPGGTIHIIPKNIYGLTEKDDYILTPKIKSGVLEWQLSGGAKRQTWFLP
ncbi:MAG: hypothetical protein CMF42_05720 [Legionellales bacterium]|nr:hypothetical protein [Legionellales bacterium]OUX66910.1 MAG: hypothetical protein CBD38_04065 [bacterium TMED178]|tara:strand:- start:1333 stop:1743 length:411 start_codon:yes stop_codon:yes gene_type:complete